MGIVILLGAPAVALHSHRHASGNGLVETIAAYLSRRLPENPAAILLIGAIAFAAIFVLLEKLDAQAEWPDVFNPAQPGELTFLKLN